MMPQRATGGFGRSLARQHKFDWYAERVDFARQRIDRSFAEEMTVSALARDVGMSMFHFSRIFTALGGIPLRLNAMTRTRWPSSYTTTRSSFSATAGVQTREDLLRCARERTIDYERQIEIEGTQVVRLFGPDTAIVTALLWIKGSRSGQAFDRRLWFSDTYVRTAQGWRYAFGQASLPLPEG